jgi:hypothetical protein
MKKIDYKEVNHLLLIPQLAGFLGSIAILLLWILGTCFETNLVSTHQIGSSGRLDYFVYIDGFSFVFSLAKEKFI